MLTAIQGIYENGQIILDELPPAQKRTKVVVTFLEEVSTDLETPGPPKSGIQFGSLTGKVGLPTDFNDPIDDLNEYML